MNIAKPESPSNRLSFSMDNNDAYKSASVQPRTRQPRKPLYKPDQSEAFKLNKNTRDPQKKLQVKINFFYSAYNNKIHTQEYMDFDDEN